MGSESSKGRNDESGFKVQPAGSVHADSSWRGSQVPSAPSLTRLERLASQHRTSSEAPAAVYRSSSEVSASHSRTGTATRSCTGSEIHGAPSQTRSEVPAARYQMRSEVTASHSLTEPGICTVNSQTRLESPTVAGRTGSRVPASRSQTGSRLRATSSMSDAKEIAFREAISRARQFSSGCSSQEIIFREGLIASQIESGVPAAVSLVRSAPAAPIQKKSEVLAAQTGAGSGVSAAGSQIESEVPAAPIRQRKVVPAARVGIGSGLSGACSEAVCPTSTESVKCNNSTKKRADEVCSTVIQFLDGVADKDWQVSLVSEQMYNKLQNSLKFFTLVKKVKDCASQTDNTGSGVDHKNLRNGDEFWPKCQMSGAVVKHVSGTQNQSCNVNGTSVSHSGSSHVLEDLCSENVKKTSRLSSASSLESLTSSQNSLADSDNPTLVCEDCKDEISIYNGDLSLSWDRHCQKPRHQLAVRPTEKEVPLVLPTKKSSSLSEERNSIDWFNKEIKRIGERDHVDISLDNFRCKICGVISVNPSNMLEHLKGKNHNARKSAKPVSTKGKAKFNCQVCQKSFKTESALMQHLRDAHSSKPELHALPSQIFTSSVKTTQDLPVKPVSKEFPGIQCIPLKAEPVKGNISLNKTISIVQKPVPANNEQTDPFWISVKGGHMFAIETVLETFSLYGTIKYIYFDPKAKEWRIRYASSLNVAFVLKNHRELEVKKRKLLVGAVAESAVAKVAGVDTPVRLSLELPKKGNGLLTSEAIVSSTCQKLIDETKFALQEQRLVKNVCSMLETSLKKYYPNCKAYQFGSRAAGLASSNSDVDIYFDIGNSYYGRSDQSERDQRNICDTVFTVLSQSKVCVKILKIPGARVPIVKFVHKSTKLACDVSFRCGLGHRNTELISFLLNLDSRIRPLLLFTKTWLRHCCIEAGKRGMTSYSLAMMVVFYLQSLPKPVLPAIDFIQGLVPPQARVFVNGWDCSIPAHPLPFQTSNTAQFSELLRGFFIFYGNFDFTNYVVCPLVGKPVPRTLFTEKRRPPPFTQPILSVYLECLHRENDVPVFDGMKPMCVQDPFELSHNVAKGVPSFLLLKFQYMCRESQKVMARWKLPNMILDAPPSSLNL